MSAISESDFWVLGTAACASPACPLGIMHTVNAGRTFTRIPAPEGVSLDGNTNSPGPPIANDIRFANASDGWVFGGGLWSTHDGGGTWRPIALSGRLQSVAQLEPGANGYVYAVFGICTAPKTATGCAFRLERSHAGSDTWSVISPPGHPGGRPVIGVHGDTIWVMYFEGSPGVEWISRDDGNLWLRGSMPCEPDLGGSFDPVSNSVIWAFCATGMAGNPWISTDGGASYANAGGGGGIFWNGAMVAAQTARQGFVGAGGSALQVTANAGGTYRALPRFGDALWVGFTDSKVGYVITENQSSSATSLWRTTDGGVDWSHVVLT